MSPWEEENDGSKFIQLKISTFPTKVKIGPQVFDVVFCENLRDDNGTSLDGQIKYGVSEIRIDSALDDFARLQTLWHEILHGILTQSAKEQSDDTEFLVDGIAYGILSVLDNNADLRNYHDCRLQELESHLPSRVDDGQGLSPLAKKEVEEIVLRALATGSV